MLRVYTTYKPLRTFLLLGLFPFLGGFALFLRYLVLIVFSDPTRSHAPSLILAAVLFMFAFVLWAIGILADIVAVNRRLLEEICLEKRRDRLLTSGTQPTFEGFKLVNLKVDQ